ncbi:MAG: TetR/AcrR family transcriptional regulator [Syntrophales bacterium]|jgi:AcrR family transcriptional regulator|nr:TetR/AcrR family transcriptional regulator [Syntrophales bacterium]MCK9391773.1 TetR/AcrR family transcriptional regulator [Syntrophales bacterium]
MGRNAHFNNEQFVDAALKIAAGQGPAAMTIAAVAREVGAPVGSVYHRFLSRDMLLAEVWLKVVSSFQEAFLQALQKGKGLDAALHTPRWVRQYPAEARILLLYRREELAAGDWQDDLKERVLRIKCTLEDGMNDYVKRAFGKAGREERNRTVYALIDVPYAAVIRYIRQGVKPPRDVDDYIRQTYSAIMGREK